MECPNPDCREEVPNHVRNCIVCGADAKVPNVRAASRLEEVESLALRVDKAEKDARTRGCCTILNDFRNYLENPSAVICRSLSKVNDLLSTDNQLFSTFYQNINSEARLPEDNEWDRIRQAVDTLLFPYYYEQIRFASLSIDGSGVTGYGDYCIILKESAIKDRATVFEENTILFVKRHRIVPGDSIPLGYKAIWQKRSDLGVAKLASRLKTTTVPTEYQSILVDSVATDADFIEVHIFGPIHRRAIQHVKGPLPHKKAHKAIFSSIKRKLAEIGATLEVS